MAEKILVDTGPIVAVLIPADAHHEWAKKEWSRLEPPLISCEAVISEAQFMVERHGGDPLSVLELIQRGTIKLAFNVQDELECLMKLQNSYSNLPMSLADACLVRLSELHPGSRVFTTDSHFSVYRRNGRQIIPLIAP